MLIILQVEEQEGGEERSCRVKSERQGEQEPLFCSIRFVCYNPCLFMILHMLFEFY